MLAISGLAENGNDLDDIQQIFSALNFYIEINGCILNGVTDISPMTVNPS